MQKAETANKTVYLPLDTGWYCFPSWFIGAEIYWTTNSDGTHSYTTDFDDQEFAKRLEYVNKLLAEYAKKGVLVQGQAMGGESNSIFTLNGAWDYNTYKTNLGDHLQTSTTPTYTVDKTTYQMGSYLGAKLLGVNGAHDGLHQAAAHAFAKVLLNKEFSLQRYEKREMIPVNIEALADSRYADNKSASVSAQEAQTKLPGFSQAATCQGSAVWTIQGNIGGALYGNNDACDSTTGLIADWAAFLKTQADTLRADSF